MITKYAPKEYSKEYKVYRKIMYVKDKPVKVSYISNKKRKSDKLNKKFVLGFICIYELGNESYISYIESFRKGIGLGTYLFFLGLSMCENDTITLSDCSNNCGKKNNIYCKLGMKYIDDNDMVGSKREIEKRFGEFKRKYGWKCN